MSMFSGKCDLADHMWICNDTEEDVQREIDKTDFYLHRPSGLCGHKLDIHTIKDLVPYYPYLISMAYGSKEDRNKVWISSESFVDSEEKERIGWYIDDVLKYYRKCKRKKIPFIKEECIKNSFWGERHSDFFSDIIDKIIENNFKYTPEDAFYDGFHLSLHDHYRKSLYEEMVKYGYSKEYAMQWCFNNRGLREILKELNERS